MLRHITYEMIDNLKITVVRYKKKMKIKKIYRKGRSLNE